VKVSFQRRYVAALALCLFLGWRTGRAPFRRNRKGQMSLAQPLYPGWLSGPALDPLPPGISAYSTIIGAPAITLSPVGKAQGASIANDGADFGPDTLNTTSNGLAEAVSAALVAAAATGTYATAQLYVMGPGTVNVPVTVTATPPAGTPQYLLGLRVVGNGQDSGLSFSAGGGLVFASTYKWNICEFQNIEIVLSNTGSATACISAPSGIAGNVSPMYFVNVQLAQDNALNNGNLINFPNASGFICYLIGCTVATGVNIVTSQDFQMTACLVGGGNVPINISCDGFVAMVGGTLASPIVISTNSGKTGVLQLSKVTLNLTTSVALSYIIDGSGMANSGRITVKDCQTLYYQLSNGALVNIGSKNLCVQWSGGTLYSSNSSNLVLAASTSGYLVSPSYFAAVALSLPNDSQFQGLGVNLAGLSGPSSIVAGTVYQNYNNCPVEVLVAVTLSPTSGAQATAGATVYDTIGGNSQQVQLVSLPAGSQVMAGAQFILRFIVPEGGGWAITTTGTVTIGTPYFHQARGTDH